MKSSRTTKHAKCTKVTCSFRVFRSSESNAGFRVSLFLFVAGLLLLYPGSSSTASEYQGKFNSANIAFYDRIRPVVPTNDTHRSSVCLVLSSGFVSFPSAKSPSVVLSFCPVTDLAVTSSPLLFLSSAQGFPDPLPLAPAVFLSSSSVPNLPAPLSGIPAFRPGILDPVPPCALSAPPPATPSVRECCSVRLSSAPALDVPRIVLSSRVDAASDLPPALPLSVGLSAFAFGEHPEPAALMLRQPAEDERVLLGLPSLALAVPAAPEHGLPLDLHSATFTPSSLSPVALAPADVSEPTVFTPCFAVSFSTVSSQVSDIPLSYACVSLSLSSSPVLESPESLCLNAPLAPESPLPPARSVFLSPSSVPDLPAPLSGVPAFRPGIPRVSPSLLAVSFTYLSPDASLAGFTTRDAVLLSLNLNSPIAIPDCLALSVADSSGAMKAVADNLLIDNVLRAAASGEINPRNPACRDMVLWFLYEYPFDERASEVFSLVLQSSAGNTVRKRTENLCAWSMSSHEGRYAAVLHYSSAHRLYQESDTRGTLQVLDLLTSNFADFFPDRRLLLHALCLVGEGRLDEAGIFLGRIASELPDSPLIPNAEFLSAWILMQDNKMDEARSILDALVTGFPKSESAAKARRVLANMIPKR